MILRSPTYIIYYLHHLLSAICCPLCFMSATCANHIDPKHQYQLIVEIVLLADLVKTLCLNLTDSLLA